LLVKIIPNRVLIFEVRTTISCNSGLVSVNFSCAILDHFINSFGIRSGLYTKISSEELEGLMKNEEHEYKKILDVLVNEYKGLSIDQRLIKGQPKRLIPEYVNSNGIDIVVMGTIGRSGIPGLLIGNTSETVLQAVNSSVITLKPDDFLSPIR
jgi:nucleotide-binding universal stress UspA family protein